MICDQECEKDGKEKSRDKIVVSHGLFSSGIMPQGAGTVGTCLSLTGSTLLNPQYAERSMTSVYVTLSGIFVRGGGIGVKSPSISRALNVARDSSRVTATRKLIGGKPT